MKLKSKYLIIVFALFVSFIGLTKVNASENNIKARDMFVILDNNSKRETGSGGSGRTGSIDQDDSKSESGSGGSGRTGSFDQDDSKKETSGGGSGTSGSFDNNDSKRETGSDIDSEFGGNLPTKDSSSSSSKKDNSSSSSKKDNSSSRGDGFKNNSSGISSSGGSSWCEDFNQVWYIFGIIIQVIYVATPLLLIVTGSIVMIQSMMKNDAGAIKKAQDALVKKIIAAVVVFLMVSIVKMVTGLVADDGWTSCANCAFNPSESNCGIEKVTTG